MQKRLEEECKVNNYDDYSTLFLFDDRRLNQQRFSCRISPMGTARTGAIVTCKGNVDVIEGYLELI